MIAGHFTHLGMRGGAGSVVSGGAASPALGWSDMVVTSVAGTELP
jgi:hypothetical protein